MSSALATTIVMVPGLGLGKEAAEPMLARLDRPTHLARLPGFGLPVGDDDVGPPALARLLEAALPEGGPPVVLVGHSAGCQVVAEAAALFPERVSALVLIGPTTDPRRASWPGLAQRWLRTACWERPTQVPTLVREYARTGLPSMLRAMDAARRHRIDLTLGDVAAPTLVVRGRHDRIAPADWCARLAPGSVVTLGAGGHMIPLTHGEQVARRVDAWLTAP